MEAVATGKRAPTFSLTDVDGKRCALAEALKQGPVLLAFFKISCPVCQFTFPFLERLHQAVKSNDSLRIWGISQNDAEETRSFARDYNCTFPLLMDAAGYPVSNQYGLTTVPTLILVQPDGVIQATSIGFVRADIEAVAGEYSRRLGQPIQVFHPADNVPDFKPG